MDALDIIEIHQLLGRYGHSIDARDWAAFAALFEADAVLDYTEVRAPHVLHGIEEIVAWFRDANHPSAHHVTNIVVDEVDGPAGREVRVHSKFFAPSTRESHSPKRWFGGDYHDVVARGADGRWRFVSKRCVGRWQFTPDEPGVDVPDHSRTF